MPHSPSNRALPPVAAAVFRALVPYAERQEVLGDLREEYAQRCAADGALAARWWLWRQLAGSVPPLLRRGWWRGWTGFEPRANRMRPGGPMFESWIMDLRYSARRLASRRTYTLLAVITLALGAGGTAAVFSVARALLIEPLPIAREDQVGILWQPGDWNEQEFVTLRPTFPGFQNMAAYRAVDATLELRGEALRSVHGIYTSAELFGVLGVRPMMGRFFENGDDRVGAERVVVLSHSLWRELGADPSMVGRQLQLGGVAQTVVGVTPPGFWFPNPTVQVWIASQLRPNNRAGMYTLVGRIADGQRMAAMQAPLASLGQMLGERWTYPPQWDKTRAPAVTAVREFLVGDVRPSLLATLVAMAVILAIACVNVAALMLGQLGGRSTEMGVRTALGAGRARLTQQLVMESLLIGTLAGGAGAALAAIGFRILVRSLPLGELADSAALDWTIFWAAVAVALLAATAIGLVPAIAIWRSRPQATLATTRTGGVSVRGGRLEGALVVAQIALAVLLAAGAGLLIRSVANLRAIDPGFAADNVAIVDAALPSQLQLAGRRQAILDAVAALQAVPGVKTVAAASKLPLRGSGDNWGIRVEGRQDQQQTTTAFRVVTHGYFDAMGAAIRRGRNFGSDDRATTRRVVIVNDALAAKYFPGEDPLGRVIHTGFDDAGEQIIGVVENMSEADLTDAPVPARYMLFEQTPYVSQDISFVLAAAERQQLPLVLQAARGVVQTASSRLALQTTITMQTVFDDAVGAPGRIATLLTILAALALLLGAVGVYGVISHLVARRTRDYGIHIALGLAPARVVSQVVTRGIQLAIAGCVLGLAATLAVTGSLSALLYGVSESDPTALGGAVAALIAVGALAAFIPAWRASRTDPAEVLRQQ